MNAKWDGSTATLYVDAVLEAAMTFSGTLASGSGGLLIGEHPTRGDYFAGTLGTIVAFDKALTAAQVADRYVWDNGAQSDTSGVFSYSVPRITAGVRGRPR